MLCELIQYYEPENKVYKELEEWMDFSIFLGDFIKKYENNINIYLSTPSNLLLSYLIVLGAVNQEFQGISDKKLKEKYLQLKEGNKVHYNSSEGWKSCSVLEVVPHPIEDTIMTIALLDNKKTKVYVPEDRWEQDIRISSLDKTAIKNASKVKNVYNLEDNKILSHLYSLENLKRLQNKNSPEIVLFANKKEWLENLEIMLFKFNDYMFRLNDFIYPCTPHFSNVNFLPSSLTDENNDVLESTIVIFLSASRALRKMDECKGQKNLYLIDRHENMEKLERLKEKIEQQIIIEGLEVKNKTLIEEINKNNIKVPRGVEVFAWE